MNGRDPISAATAIQREAARPELSAAVRASAGSGKTRVLIDRFVRLCVEGEHNDVHPRSILAITFTRKAATEIRERLLDRARRLALESDAERRRILGELFGGRPDPAPLPAEEDRAARLYERLLEDPAGLQVGTIHSFCQRILARFATEAGLDPHAGLIEDREDLLDEALDRLMVEIATDPRLGELAADLGGRPGSVRKRVRSVFQEQMRLDRWLRRDAVALDTDARPRVPLAPVLLAELRAALLGDPDAPVAADDRAPALLEAAAKFAAGGLDAVAAELAPEEMDKLGKALAALRDQVAGAADAQAVRAALLTTGGQLRVFSRVRDADLKARFQELVTGAAAAVLGELRRLDLAVLYRLNRAALALGLRALDILDELKRRDRVLDFGDLEDMACVLMGDRARAMSLLFRLDDSLRHVLVDEFQDTNFNQWDILRPFVDEFLGGDDGAGAGPPTVFFVGDLKQSIYGFRGAEPSLFAGVMELLADREHRTHDLPTNFRSLPPMVDGVGALFSAEPLVSRLPAGEAATVQQLAARPGGAGPVTVVAAYEDAPDGRSGHQLAATAAAGIVRDLVDGGTVTVDDEGERPLRWSDVMVLYRSRTGVSLYEQAFRTAGVPIEPAGRGMLAASREVQDVLALLRFLVWPEDDVALATVLRSPVMRLSETAFQQLLAARGLFKPAPDGGFLPPAGLWTTLRKSAADDDELAPVVKRLEDWRSDTGFVTCHELLRRIYREGHLPARYERARGPQARINLERLYDLALAPEIAAAPTVRRFADLVEKASRRGGQEEGTPGGGAGGGRVRFMTIHGAKGLEAPVVLLVDADRPLSDRTTEVRLDPGDSATPVVFGATRGYRLGWEGAEEVLAADALQVAGEAAARAAEVEETNLLYVALTRARDRLYVLGGRGNARRDGEPRTPLRRLQAAAAAAPDPSVTLDDPTCLQRPPAPVERVSAETAGLAPRLWEPPVLGGGAVAEAPSAAARHGGDEDGVHVVAAGAVEHGLRVHLLLQLAAERGGMPPGAGPAHDEARAVFDDPRLDRVFRPETTGGRGLAEAPIITRGEDAPVAGYIDRLIVRPDRVDIVDYKTDRWGGDRARCEELQARYAPQLAIYRDAVARLYPGLAVHAWLLLTDPAGRSTAESGLLEILI